MLFFFQGHSVQIASRCIWDDGKDNSASVTFRNESIYAVATLFAVYFE